VTLGSALQQILRELDRAEIAHMLAGSFASTYHGEPRTTQDIDLVIDCDEAALDRFVGQLDSDHFYVGREAADQAWLRRGQFNVILLESGWEVDLILRKDREFAREEFARREPADIAGVRAFVATAEDTILSKLEGSRAGGSERQLRDVVGILRMRAGEIDEPYIERWAAVLGVVEEWHRARSEAASDRDPGRS